MCRSIHALFNFDPPATREEIHEASLQFVRKVAGTRHPSHANEPAFEKAVDDVAKTVQRLLAALVTTAPPRDRAGEATRARARAAKRFGPNRF